MYLLEYIKYKIDIFFVRRFCRNIVKNDVRRNNKIILYYGQLIKEARKEFSEDNKPTVDLFLKETLDKALEKF